MNTDQATLVLDKPTAWDNNGREVRILEGLATLGLSRAPWGFSRGLDRARKWRIMGIAECDVETVAKFVRSSGAPDATVHGATVEWLNYGCW